MKKTLTFGFRPGTHVALSKKCFNSSFRASFGKEVWCGSVSCPFLLKRAQIKSNFEAFLNVILYDNITYCTFFSMIISIRAGATHVPSYLRLRFRISTVAFLSFHSPLIKLWKKKLFIFRVDNKRWSLVWIKGFANFKVKENILSNLRIRNQRTQNVHSVDQNK
jgi:hypothetical protein